MKSLLIGEVKQATHAELKTENHKGLITGISIDSRTTKPGDLFIALRGRNHDGHRFIDQAVAAGARAVLVDRPLPISEEVRQRGVCMLMTPDTLAALGQLARFYRQVLGHGVTVIAVTGSNGKTTTREMIYHTLSHSRRGWRSPGNFNNAIGVPLSVFGIEPDHDFAVLELATNAPGEIAALSRIVGPDIAVITGVAASHLQGLKDIEGVCAEKAAIITGMKERGTVVCNTQYPPLLEKLRPLGHTVIRYGAEDTHADIYASNIGYQNGMLCFMTNDRCAIRLPALGRCNVNNALAALAVVRRMGLRSEDFARAITSFSGVAQRMTVHRVNGITVIDDSYNANPASMAAALQELRHFPDARRRILVCGDMGELGDQAEHFHRELGRQVVKSGIELLLTAGPLSALTAQAAVEAGMGISDVQKAISSRRLARLIKSMIRDEDVILVKGSRSMEMEKVVESLKRYRGNRPILRTHIKEIAPKSKSRNASSQSLR